ncbi:hypothetical protein GW17_00057940 [Ensete ventricosum]|nr:hypothetical protein GW17_00057940 [Ensete ventricosum]
MQGWLHATRAIGRRRLHWQPGHKGQSPAARAAANRGDHLWARWLRAIMTTPTGGYATYRGGRLLAWHRR